MTSQLTGELVDVLSCRQQGGVRLLLGALRVELLAHEQLGEEALAALGSGAGSGATGGARGGGVICKEKGDC